MVNAQNWLESLINLENQEKVNTKEKRTEAKELFIYEQLEGILDLVDFTNLAYIYISCQVDTKQFEIINQQAGVEIIPNNWIDINIVFAKKDDNSGKTYQQHWEEKGFNHEEVKEWFSAWGGSFAPNGYDLYAWLKNEKKVDSAWVLNNIDHDNKLELFEKCAEEYGEYNLKKKYGLCPECHKANTGGEWCQLCNAKHFKEDFKNWTSGNPEIDKVIQKSQLSATNPIGLLEWFPYEQFAGIEYLAQGGFGMVYKAEREKGVINKWNNNEKKWERGQNNKFVLKILKDSQNVTNHFLQEISNCQTVTQKQASPIVPCLGISQEPETRNYVMVMPYIDESDLRKFLQNHSNELEFRDKVEQLVSIAVPLEAIHSQNLVHKDFHPGNILIRKDRDNNFIPFIADLGLSRPANETNQGKIYGVLPYVAPEVLRGEKYTSAADIYSFSMVIYEMVSELFPYYDLVHDNDLAQKICKGLRPNLDEIIAPPLLKDLIRKCWNADPLIRPTARELITTLVFWSDRELGEIEKYNEFAHQVQEAEELGKKLSSQANKRICKVHSQATRTSRLLDFPNLPQPQNNLSQEWQTTTLLELQIKGVEKELEIIKEPLNNGLVQLLDKFIEIKKQALKNKEDKQVKKQVREVKKLLSEKGFSEKKINEVIRYCEKLAELEKQLEQEKLSSQLIKINDKIKGKQKQIVVIQGTLGEESTELVQKFIKVNKELIKNDNNNNKELREEVKNLHQLLRSKGFSKEEMEKIIEYCEILVDLEWQVDQWNEVNDKTNLRELQEYIEIPPKSN